MSLVINHANYFDVNQEKFVDGKTLVIENGLIDGIYDDGGYESKSDDQIIDASNKFIIPGMIDCHVHISGTANPQGEREFLRHKDDYFSFIGLKLSQSHLKNGFTTIRDCGNRYNYGPSLKRIFERNILPGPRLLNANLPMLQYGNQEFIGPEPLKDLYGEAQNMSGKDGVIHGIRARINSGSDFIKVIVTGGVLHGQANKLDNAFFTLEELEAMVEEAHRMNIQLASHAHSPTGMLNAVKAGIDTIEHATLITEEIMDLMITKGTHLTATHGPPVLFKKKEIASQMNPEVLKKAEKVIEKMYENHITAFEKGVKFSFGTDAGTPGNPNGISTLELIRMVENVKMTPTQALLCATKWSSEAIAMENEIGSIEIGKAADLSILKENPLENIYTMQTNDIFSHVIKDGNILVKDDQLISSS